MRGSKVIRLDYWKDDPRFSAQISIFSNPSEVRISAQPDKFFSVSENGISFSPGIGNNINVQGLNQNMIFGGMVANLDFPLSIIPITFANPMPVQRFKPPLEELVPIIRDLSKASSAFLGA